MGEDACVAMMAILNEGAFPKGLNCTFVALVPKKHKPIEISDFRPISLCNVVYKLVSNVTPGRLTTNNVLMAFEVFHSMHCHSR